MHKLRQALQLLQHRMPTNGALFVAMQSLLRLCFCLLRMQAIPLPPSSLQKDTVILPGMEGLFGVKANHVPVIAQLKPGLVEMHSGGEVEKFFISGGWAYVHPDGITDIQTLEAVTLDQVGSFVSAGGGAVTVPCVLLLW